MKKLNKLKCYTFFMLAAIAASFMPACFGQENSYNTGRPPSAFSSCCCKRDGQRQEEIFYSCTLVEEETCPEETKKYPQEAVNCPSSLIVKKYKG